MLTPKDMLWSQHRGQHLSSHWIVQTHGRILLQCISPVRSEPDQKAVAKFQCAFKIKVCVEGISVQVWVHMCATGAHVCIHETMEESSSIAPHLLYGSRLSQWTWRSPVHLDKAAMPACLGSKPQPLHYTVPTEPASQPLHVYVFLNGGKKS